MSTITIPAVEILSTTENRNFCLRRNKRLSPSMLPCLHASMPSPTCKLPTMPELLLKTPLHDEHLALGGRMVPFAGYDMPVQYTGVIAESKAVREGAGMFDVSHMARLWLRGERALDFLEWVTSNEVSKLEDRRGQYSLLPNENGGIVDDIIVYRIGPETFRMVVNASNHEKDVAWLR